MNHDILQICESIGFTPKDRKAIDAARLKAESIASTINKIVADPSHAPSESYFSFLHLEADRLERVLIDEPTHMNAEVFHAALIRFDEAQKTQQRIGAALGIALANVSQSISGTVQAHLDRVQSRIETEASTRRAELAATRHGLFNTSDESRALEARVTALLADLASERTEAASDPLGFIERRGLAMHSEPEQADTEAA